MNCIFNRSNFLLGFFLTLAIFLPLASLRAQFKGRNFAEHLTINNVKAEIILNDFGQRGFSLTSGPLNALSDEDIAAGWVSWSFLPDYIASEDEEAIKQYVLDSHFGFTNDANNYLIDDEFFVENASRRLVIFSWTCSTDACDAVDDISDIKFISEEAVNYHQLPAGQKIKLTNFK